MAETISPYGELNPAHYYTPESAARALGMTKRWVLDNVLNSDEAEHRRKGDFIGIPGWVLAQWIERDLRTKSQWKENGEEAAEPPKKSKSGSKP